MYYDTCIMFGIVKSLFLLYEMLFDSVSSGNPLTQVVNHLYIIIGVEGILIVLLVISSAVLIMLLFRRKLRNKGHTCMCIYVYTYTHFPV